GPADAVDPAENELGLGGHPADPGDKQRGEDQRLERRVEAHGAEVAHAPEVSYAASGGCGLFGLRRRLLLDTARATSEEVRDPQDRDAVDWVERAQRRHALAGSSKDELDDHQNEQDDREPDLLAVDD